jgi:hypothetical protein
LKRTSSVFICLIVSFALFVCLSPAVEATDFGIPVTGQIKLKQTTATITVQYFKGEEGKAKDNLDYCAKILPILEDLIGVDLPPYFKTIEIYESANLDYKWAGGENNSSR